MLIKLNVRKHFIGQLFFYISKSIVLNTMLILRRLLYINYLLAFFLFFLLGNSTAQNKDSPWTIRCETISQLETEGCIMYQELLLKEGGLPVLQFSIGMIHPNKKQPIVLITLPLGIYLPTGVTLMIDKRDEVNFPIERCDPDGCHVLVTLTEKRVQALKSGADLQISFNDGDKQPLLIPLSLEGFDKAFTEISSSP